MYFVILVQKYLDIFIVYKKLSFSVLFSDFISQDSAVMYNEISSVFHVIFSK